MFLDQPFKVGIRAWCCKESDDGDGNWNTRTCTKEWSFFLTKEWLDDPNMVDMLTQFYGMKIEF